MVPTRAVWQHPRGGSKISRFEDDREGQFHSQVFDRYSRYEPHIAEGLTQMFVAGVSTRHPWGKWPIAYWEWLPVLVR